MLNFSHTQIWTLVSSGLWSFWRIKNGEQFIIVSLFLICWEVAVWVCKTPLRQLNLIKTFQAWSLSTKYSRSILIIFWFINSQWQTINIKRWLWFKTNNPKLQRPLQLGWRQCWADTTLTTISQHDCILKQIIHNYTGPPPFLGSCWRSKVIQLPFFPISALPPFLPESPTGMPWQQTMSQDGCSMHTSN